MFIICYFHDLFAQIPEFTSQSLFFSRVIEFSNIPFLPWWCRKLRESIPKKDLILNNFPFLFSIFAHTLNLFP